MAKKVTQIDENTGKVVTGKVPRGHSTEEPRTTKHFGLGDSIRTIVRDLKR